MVVPGRNSQPAPVRIEAHQAGVVGEKESDLVAFDEYSRYWRVGGGQTPPFIQGLLFGGARIGTTAIRQQPKQQQASGELPQMRRARSEMRFQSRKEMRSVRAGQIQTTNSLSCAEKSPPNPRLKRDE